MKKIILFSVVSLWFAFFGFINNSWAQNSFECTTATMGGTAIVGNSQLINECEALKKFYSGFDGKNWKDTNGNITKWLDDNEINNWEGISADKEGIKAIGLGGENKYPCNSNNYSIIPNVSGDINNIDFSAFPSLQKIFMGCNNNITGVFPDLSSNTKLQTVELQNLDGITGTLTSLNGLTDLRNLTIWLDGIAGILPDFDNKPEILSINLNLPGLDPHPMPSFSNNTKLTYINCYKCNLTGEVPSFDANSNLKTVSLIYNQLTGTVPSFSNNPLLTEITLSGNALKGTIPDLSYFPNLYFLSLFSNELTGSIPDFSPNPKLRHLYLHNNELTGAMPDLSVLTNLTNLNIRNNRITGPLPDPSQFSESLFSLYLNENCWNNTESASSWYTENTAGLKHLYYLTNNDTCGDLMTSTPTTAPTNNNPSPTPNSNPTATQILSICNVNPTHQSCLSGGGTAEKAYAVSVCACDELSAFQNTCESILLEKSEVENCNKEEKISESICANNIATEMGYEVCDRAMECTCNYKKTVKSTNKNVQNNNDILQQIFGKKSTKKIKMPAKTKYNSATINAVQTINQNIRQEIGPIKPVFSSGVTFMPLNSRFIEIYKQASPFTDADYHTEDFAPSMALYLQEIIDVDPSNTEIKIFEPLTGDYVVKTMQKLVKTRLRTSKKDQINYGQMRASIEHVLGLNLYMFDALTNDLKDKSPQTRVTRGDFHDLLYRGLTEHYHWTN